MLNKDKLDYVFGKPPENQDVLWRVEFQRYSVCTLDRNGVENYHVTDGRLEARWFPIMRRTPKGARLLDGRFVLLTARKKFACNTILEALQSFKARKERQKTILSSRLAETSRALDAVNNQISNMK